METKVIKAFGTEAVNVPLHEMNINRRELKPHDVEMEILYCGITSFKHLIAFNVRGYPMYGNN